MNGRTAQCDACRRLKSDCRWTARVGVSHPYCLCFTCREYWTRIGHELRNIDPEYADESVAVSK